ncbi:MAG: hypothetical protein K6G10_04550 [Butyrivibrio sp.]|nr:hypothetical protein [Butyrivibrio sp.]
MKKVDQENYNPKTIDAVRFCGRYIDPKDSRIRLINLTSAGLIITGIVVSCVYLV